MAEYVHNHVIEITIPPGIKRVCWQPRENGIFCDGRPDGAPSETVTGRRSIEYDRNFD
jgi:hypothetical protein